MQPALALLLAAVVQEIGQADVVVQGQAEPGAPNPYRLDLLADDEVVTEVVDSATSVSFGDRHTR